ncbi:hypothetical protein FK220_012980 [Flavobacteriaceae bacterium TP-CH-4]|uniref:Iron-binding zinc finger CDGSH type domain-containing protein n=1 Tax=Pelagihabitans pacificus TaxID=2696054 RepID=A0A967ATT6_9FLAO|nr:(4Fe-4S)-binding protein [Pelagihabitans pacificus]NHF60261.1 hypothetical protein [Pelagihabitans pacificus]
MSEREIVKRYSNGELTVVWKPKKCIHSGICVKTLPQVYDPNEKPWIKAENATVEELKSQIELCPSGALTYELEGTEENGSTSKTDTEVRVRENGPLLINGVLTVTLGDGTVEKKTGNTAFCRCGASNNKPYCDGTHRSMDFRG